MSDLIERLEEATQWDDSPSILIHEAIARIAALEAQLAERVKVKPLDDAARRKIELWFFRDMSGEQRLKLFSLFGMPVDEIGQTHGHQRIALRRVFRILSALAATPPAPNVTEEMVDAALAEVRKHPRTKDQMAKLRSSVRRQIEAALTAAQEAGKP